MELDPQLVDPICEGSIVQVVYESCLSILQLENIKIWSTSYSFPPEICFLRQIFLPLQICCPHQIFSHKIFFHHRFVFHLRFVFHIIFSSHFFSHNFFSSHQICFPPQIFFLLRFVFHVKFIFHIKFFHLRFFPPQIGPYTAFTNPPMSFARSQIPE